MALFVNRLNFGDSIIAGSFTLGLLGASADYPGDGRSPSCYPRPRSDREVWRWSHQTSNNPKSCSSSCLSKHHDRFNTFRLVVFRAKQLQFSLQQQHIFCLISPILFLIRNGAAIPPVCNCYQRYRS